MFILLGSILPFESTIFISMTLPILVSLFIIPLIYILVLSRSNRNLLDLKCRKREIAYTAVGILLFSLIYFVTNKDKFGSQITLFLMIHYMIAAFCEEFLYRNIILKRLLESWGIISSIIISSVIFSVIGHIGESPVDNLIYRFPLGIFFCIFRLKSKSLLYTSAIHAFYNLILIAA